MGSSSSICSLLVATTLGVIVPDRDEKKSGGGIGGGGYVGEGEGVLRGVDSRGGEEEAKFGVRRLES